MKNHRLRNAVLLFIPALMSSCMGLSKADNAQEAVPTSSLNASESGTSGIAAFQSSFYAFSRTNCAACHGVAQAPLFAVSDFQAAYAAADNPVYVNFALPSSSLFVTRAGDGHCGTAACSSNSSAALSQIETWSTAELAAEKTGGSSGTTNADLPPILTTSLAIPGNLPTGANFAVMRWALGALSPSNSQFTGANAKAIFELQIQLSSSSTYIVKDPRIAGIATPIDIRGIHVLINTASGSGPGNEDTQGNYWDGDNVNAQPFALPTPLPTTALTSIPLDTNSMPISVLSSNDKLTIGFDQITAGTLMVALAPTYSSIAANIITPSCLSCHNASNARGGVDLSSYNAVKNQVTAGNPLGSPFYESVTTGTPLMPEGGDALSTAQLQAISTWINNGALNN